MVQARSDKETKLWARVLQENIEILTKRAVPLELSESSEEALGDCEKVGVCMFIFICMCIFLPARP